MIERQFHHWEKWECYKAGFYSTNIPDNMTHNLCAMAYRDFLSNIPEFKIALDRVINEWPNSCEQFLTNENINRIAWLGQASMCISLSIPSMYKHGFRLLNRDQQIIANKTAEEKLINYLTGKFYEYPPKDSRIYRGMETMRLF